MFALIKHVQAPDTNQVNVIVTTRTHHDAYLQLLSESEPLYPHYQTKADGIHHKSFVDPDQNVRIDLMIQEVPVIQKGEAS